MTIEWKKSSWRNYDETVTIAHELELGKFSICVYNRSGVFDWHVYDQSEDGLDDGKALSLESAQADAIQALRNEIEETIKLLSELSK